MLCASLPGFPKYNIYPDGRIISAGTGKGIKNGRILKKSLSDGYGCVTLYQNGKRKTFKIHRLLAMCFMPCNVDFNTITVDHINRDRLDNRLENLRWADVFVQSNNHGDYRNNTSGEKHICFEKRTNKWVFNKTKHGIRYNKQVDTKE